MKKAVVTAAAVVLMALTALVVGATSASAHTGNITATENCENWHVSVSLDHNVTHDRTVSVLTTIPGTVGIDQSHFDTSFGEIWSASGQSPASGTVTLVIDAGEQQEFSTSASIHPQEGCQEVTTSTTTIPPITTTTTMPVTTTTIPSTSTTSSTITKNTSTTICLHARGCCLQDCGPTLKLGHSKAVATPVTPELPKTGGGNVFPVFVLGSALTLGGAALLLGRNRRTR